MLEIQRLCPVSLIGKILKENPSLTFNHEKKLSLIPTMLFVIYVLIVWWRKCLRKLIKRKILKNLINLTEKPLIWVSWIKKRRPMINFWIFIRSKGKNLGALWRSLKYSRRRYSRRLKFLRNLRFRNLWNLKKLSLLRESKEMMKRKEIREVLNCQKLEVKKQTKRKKFQKNLIFRKIQQKMIKKRKILNH